MLINSITPVSGAAGKSYFWQHFTENVFLYYQKVKATNYKRLTTAGSKETYHRLGFFFAKVTTLNVSILLALTVSDIIKTIEINIDTLYCFGRARVKTWYYDFLHFLPLFLKFIC